MLWLYIIAVYIVSVVLCVWSIRYERSFTNYNDVWWIEIVISLVPIANVIYVIFVLLGIWGFNDYRVPRWLIRLYGGR